MRETPLLKTVINILETQDRPLSVPELTRLLKSKKLAPNKTTLYRLLERLKEQALIQEVLLNNRVTHYELKKKHHHHFVCNQCDYVKCIEDKELENKIHQLKDQLKDQGLDINQHQFSFSGCCPNCQ